MRDRSEVKDASEREPQLRRSIGPAQMALYGLGSMLGAGIYGLIGKAAGVAGNAVWLAFIVALVAALLTALSYASLGSRYPRADHRARLWLSAVEFHDRTGAALLGAHLDRHPGPRVRRQYGRGCSASRPCRCGCSRSASC